MVMTGASNSLLNESSGLKGRVNTRGVRGARVLAAREGVTDTKRRGLGHAGAIGLNQKDQQEHNSLRQREQHALMCVTMHMCVTMNYMGVVH